MVVNLYVFRIEQFLRISFGETEKGVNFIKYQLFPHSIMRIATGVDILVSRGLYYTNKYATPKLLLHAAHDMLLGATVGQKDPRYVYADFHVHLPVTTLVKPLLEDVATRVDIMSITGRTLDEAFADHLLFEDAVRKLDQEGIEHDVLGQRLVRAYPYGKEQNPLLLVRATEVYPREMQGVVIVGSILQPNWYHGKPVLDDVVKAADDIGAFRFFDHPFSIHDDVVHFRYPTEEEVKRRIGYFERYHAVIEIWNHQNTFYLLFSNEIAKDVAEQRGLVGIANSDTHFNPHDIGLSRTGIPRELLNLGSEEAFLVSLQKALCPDHKEALLIDAHYASLWTFFPHMIVPPIRRKLGVGK